MRKFSSIIRKVAAGTACACALTLTVPAWGLQAEAASATIAFSDPDAQVGESFTVNVKIQSKDGKIGDSDLLLSYDPNVLEFVSGDSASGGAGSVKIKAASAGENTAAFKLTFKAIGPGNTNITVGDYEIYDADSQPMDISKVGSSAIRVQGTAGQSSEVALSGLEVSPGVLIPEFSPSVTAYTVNVAIDVEKIAVSAVAQDSGATVSVSGGDNLVEGTNQVVCTVTAPDGVTKREYQITVNKTAIPEAQGPMPGADGVVLSNQMVMVDGESYGIAQSFSSRLIPEGFREQATDYNGAGVMAAVSDSGMELLYLVKADGTGQFFVLDDSGAFAPFVTIQVAQKTIVVLTPDSSVEIPERFNETVIQLNGSYRVTGWVPAGDPDQKYCLVYGMNSSGVKDFYCYDLAEKTIQRYFPAPPNKYDDAQVDAIIDSYNALQDAYNQRFLYIAGLAVLSAILLIILLNVLLRRLFGRGRKRDDYYRDDEGEAPRRTSRPRREEYYNPEPRERAVRRSQEGPEVPVHQTQAEREMRKKKRDDDLDIIDL